MDSFRSLSGLGTCSLFRLVPNSWGLWGVREDAQSRDVSKEGGESREAAQERPGLGLFPLSESTSHTRAPGTGEEFTSDAQLDADQGAG